MTQLAFAEASEFYRVDAALKLDPKRRSTLGQFMTPAPIGRFMASLFSDFSGDLHVLDPGAGVGSLTAALVEFMGQAQLDFAGKLRGLTTLSSFHRVPELSALVHPVGCAFGG